MEIDNRAAIHFRGGDEQRHDTNNGVLAVHAARVPPITIPIDLNVKFINSALAGANKINLTLPLSNVGFYIKDQNEWIPPIAWWLEYLDNESGGC